MQADLKQLNLKKTFSFLQNLDYNEEEGIEVEPLRNITRIEKDLED